MTLAAALSETERRLSRISPSAFAITIAVHALAVLIATYVYSEGSFREHPANSAALTLIDLSPEGGGAIDDRPPTIAATAAASLASLANVATPPAPVVVATTAVIGVPAGSLGSTGFDPYAGASPIRPAVSNKAAQAEAMLPQGTSPDVAPPLDAVLAQVRGRIAQAAHGARGAIELEALVDGDGVVREVRVMGGDLAASISPGDLSLLLRGLRLFPANDMVTPHWRTLPDIRL